MHIYIYTHTFYHSSMCSFGGILGNFALELGPKSPALSKKTCQWKMPGAKSDRKIRDTLEPSAERSRAGEEVPSLSHHIPAPRGQAGSDKSWLMKKH